MCFELKEKEIENYGQSGYLFTSLRDKADILQIPFNEKEDHKEV